MKPEAIQGAPMVNGGQLMLSGLMDQLGQLQRQISELAARGLPQETPSAPQGPAPVITPKRRGRPPKNALLAKPGVIPEPPAPMPVRVPDLRERIELALTRESLNLEQLSKTLHEPVEKITEMIAQLRAEQRIFNVGIGESPTWTWRVGDIDPPKLREIIRRLISERPMSTRDLTNATGAPMPKVGGHIVDIQRSGANIINLAAGHAGIWFITDGARDARLPPKTPPKQLKPKK